MKKVTLSAAILALMMMGCSDAGLDNSVASVNEVNADQGRALLAKLTPEPISSGEVGLEHSGYKRYVYPEDGIAVRVHSRPDDFTWKSRGRATIWVETSVAADLAWDSKAATRGFDVYTAELPVPYEQVGVVAAYGAVWNLGKSSQNEFSSVTYGGTLPDSLAYSVYQKYILQAVYNINHRRPIDEIP